MPKIGKTTPEEIDQVNETPFFEEMKPVKQHFFSPQIKILMIVLIVAVVLVGLGLVSRFTNLNVLGLNKNSQLKTVGWQAVFLDNGPVYFGKITEQTNDLLFLKDIYYLDFSQPLQPSGNEATSTANQLPSLVKLGNELHKPKDKMVINMDHVILIEELEPDSEVVNAILRYNEDLP